MIGKYLKALMIKEKQLFVDLKKLQYLAQRSQNDNPELMILRKDNNEWLKIGLANIESQTDEIQKQLFNKLKDDKFMKSATK